MTAPLPIWGQQLDMPVEGVLVPISNQPFDNPGDRTEFTDFK